MAISLTCECGKKLAVKEELAGKRVKCPSCESLITVPSLADEPPPRKRPAAAVDDDEDQGDEEARPRKKKKKKRAKSNKMLWIGASVGVLVLGFCCLGLAGGGIWYFVINKSPEKTIIGKWHVDVAQMKANPPKNRQITKKEEDEMGKVWFEYKSDNDVLLSVDRITIAGKYKVLSTVGDTLRIEWTLSLLGMSQTQQFEVKVVDRDHLIMTPLNAPNAGMFGGNKESLYLKRA